MSESFEYPSTFARFYDVIYHTIRDSVDSEFFLDTIKEVDGTVLEIGVGTGRFFSSALQDGADIYGIDISRSMTDVLKKKLDPAAHSRVMTGDAGTMKLGKKFDLIIAPFRVFSHVIETGAQLSFLNNVWEHLNENGKFIFDLFVPDPKLLHEGVYNVTDFEGEYEPGKKLRRIVTSIPDIINQLLDVTMHFEWEEDEKWNTNEWNFKMRYYFRFELEHLIKLSKLKLLKIYGDYHRNELTRDSKEFVLVCSK